MDPEPFVNKRIVLRCKNNLSYAGVVRGVAEPAGMRRALIVELDATSGFAILCPLDFINEVKVIPIHEDVN